MKRTGNVPRRRLRLEMLCTVSVASNAVLKSITLSLIDDKDRLKCLRFNINRGEKLPAYCFVVPATAFYVCIFHVNITFQRGLSRLLVLMLNVIK